MQFFAKMATSFLEKLPLMPDRKVPGVELTVDNHASGLCSAVGIAQGIKNGAHKSACFLFEKEY